jgi:NAD+ kinase
MAEGKKARIRKVGIVVRPDSRGAKQRARELAEWLEQRQISVLAHVQWAASDSKRRVVSREVMMREADLVVVLGGDGSLLGVARLTGGKSVPVVGIHHGDFGFLTDSGKGNLFERMERVLAGDCNIKRRTMLAVAVRRGGKVVMRSQALNDAVVARGSISRMLTLEVAVGSEHLAEFLGDGLVVATPTGSTAYSLSAGGPVVEPSMSAIVLTPISPHTLSSRPLVLSDRSSISIHIAADCDDAVLTVDGQESVELEAGDVVEVAKSRHQVSIVSLSDEGFFGILRRKLHWGARGDRVRRRVN